MNDEDKTTRAECVRIAHARTAGIGGIGEVMETAERLWQFILQGRDVLRDRNRYAEAVEPQASEERASA